MLVVLSEASFHDQSSINGRELHALTEAARLLGCRIYPLPPDFSVCETAENALAYLPEADPPLPGLWVGYIPAPERYAAVYAAAAARGLLLLNSPDQYQTAMEFDRFYPLLGELTPQSVVLRSLDDCRLVGAQLGYPVFVKGSVKSNKEQGWQACVAQDEAELRALVEGLLARPSRSRGRAIARRLVELRRVETTHEGFPLGREYRLFVYGGTVLAYGFYWDEYADAARLDAAEERQIKALALEAARRVAVPFLAVDVGQLATGEWIVIEVGDGQFSGLSQVAALELWSSLLERVYRL